MDYLKLAAEAKGKCPCFINLDETPIPQAATKAHGYFRQADYSEARPRRRLSGKLRRGIATHVAVIADDTAVQAALPQTFLVNARLLKPTVVAHPLAAPRVEFQIGLSAWNSKEKMVAILDRINAAMAAFPQKQAILLLDCAPCHTQWEVISKANALNLWLLFVPARLTSLLQPLDVCAFGAYKHRLRRAFLCREAEGTLSRKAWVDELAKLVKHFWRAVRWRSAFERVGVQEIGRAPHLTKELQKLQLARNIAEAPPTKEALQRILPKGHRSIWTSVFLLPAKLAAVELPELL